MRYVVLLRGVNVGGRNKVPMAVLRERLARDFTGVATYIQSGNVVLESELTAAGVSAHVEDVLAAGFDLDTGPVRALTLGAEAFGSVLDDAPAGFGSEPGTYRYDVGFYVGVSAAEVEPHVPADPAVDEVAFGPLAFYHRRLNALATRSRVTRIVGTPVYASLTLRNWRTTTTLAEMVGAPHEAHGTSPGGDAAGA
ncbi:DUF1697 domain-containing protein [Kineococcus gypseus]|uniref:DUF1697 domain-containing protein n=1 Tax=Kineococcus gypseus TaxID=1637102 RepID=UPI003D7D8810